MITTFKTSEKIHSFQVKFTFRDFSFDVARYNELIRSRETLEIEVKRQEAFLTRVCQAAFSDVIIAWLHLKAMNCFVEAVLRFGVPPNFASFILKPSKNTTRQAKLRSDLLDVFSSSGLFGHSFIDQATSVSEGPNGGEEAEYFPYVSLSFSPLSAPKQ